MAKSLFLTALAVAGAALCGFTTDSASRSSSAASGMITMAEAKSRTGSEWVGRKIYQILTDRFATTEANPCQGSACNMNKYLGGTYEGAMQQLDYIKGMGFDAIWISPIITNLENWNGIAGYHGYWATNFFDVNPHFGTRQNLIDFVAACHAKGIWVMVDIVINHVGPIGTDYSQISPFNDASHYHNPCAVNQYVCFTSEVQTCRLADLPDLDQSNPYVQQKLQEAMSWLIETFDFDGMRADTVMYVPVSNWQGVYNAVNKTFITGEVWSDFSCNDAYITQGAIASTLNYPVYTALRNAFLYNNGMNGLGDVWREQATLPNPDWQVNFIDNHDNDRFLSVGGANMNNYMSAIAYLYFTNGIPCIYYGTEQQMKGLISDNTCREPLWTTGYKTTNNLYGWIGQLNAFYDTMNITTGSATSVVEERWRDQSVYCSIRAAVPAMLCVTNTPSQDQTRTIPNLQLFAGKKVCVLGHNGLTLTGAATMDITIPAGFSPYIMYAC